MFCTPAEYATLGSPRSLEMRQIKARINMLYSSAMKIIDENEDVSVALFESRLFGIALDTLNGSFDKRIQNLKGEDRIGSSITYRTAINSFKKYAVYPETDEDIIKACGIRFSEITPAWLSGYERWMIKGGNSLNSVGINLRSLRAIFNEAITNHVVPAALYPFKAYKIKSERKFKIPLSDKEVLQLKDHHPEDSDQARALDFWKFSYYCNGMNMVDVARLRHSDIQDEFIVYDRSKTRNTKISFKKIIIPIDHEIQDIISRRRAPTLDPDGYIFPILEKGLAAVTIKNRVQKFIKEINDGLRGIAKDLKFKKKLTTVIARHTFANRMSNFGADRRMIQEALGHQNSETTEHYLGTMDIEKIRKARKAL